MEELDFLKGRDLSSLSHRLDFLSQVKERGHLLTLLEIPLEVLQGGEVEAHEILGEAQLLLGIVLQRSDRVNDHVIRADVRAVHLQHQEQRSATQLQ